MKMSAVQSTPRAASPSNWFGSRLATLLGAPATLWLAIFFVGPMGYLIALSFALKGVYGGVTWSFSFENYARTFEAVYLTIFSQSLWLALTTTVLCFAIAVPTAWQIASLHRARRGLWLTLLSVPFLMNMITRIYALKTVVGYDGPLAVLLRPLLGQDFDALVLSQNQVLVLYGMVATYLPFMLFPIYVSFEKFDFQQVEAVYDLGGSSWLALTKVILPQMKPAIASGVIMVFVPALGEFVIPDLLGGARVMLSGNLITEQFLKSRDWPFGAALAVELIAFMAAFTWAFSTWGLQKVRLRRPG